MGTHTFMSERNFNELKRRSKPKIDAFTAAKCDHFENIKTEKMLFDSFSI